MVNFTFLCLFFMAKTGSTCDQRKSTFQTPWFIFTGSCKKNTYFGANGYSRAKQETKKVLLWILCKNLRIKWFITQNKKGEAYAFILHWL